MRTFRILVLSIAPLVTVSGSAAEEETPPVGRKVEDFTLDDYRGQSHSLTDYAESRLVVLTFLGTECPLAKLYSPRLAALAKEYESQGVTFLAVNANRQDSLTEIAAHARRHGIEFPVLKDLGNELADRLGAVRTPETFVLDPDRIIRYHGRIDDQYGVGHVRDEPTRKDLKLAVDQLLAAEPVEVPRTESVGCYIGRVREVDAESDVTYSNQIARILQRRCVECHREGEIAPFALTKYEEVAGWADTITEVVRNGRMPPWHASPEHGRFANDRRLTDEEQELIFEWVAAGAPQGDPAELPEPRTFVAGWQLPREPDAVV
ncbi:MAG: redoxin domain-containing protein, partial [Planctomycetaceae bacterium]